MRYYVIAGERSGDLHASNLMRKLLEKDPSAVFRFLGGDMMQQVAPEGLVKHYKEINFMGFWEVFINLPIILRNLSFTKKDILDYRPDALILVDFSGFNMRMARFAKKHGIATHYYIAPKVWAWNTSRAKSIKKWVDHLYVILPFEVDFFRKFDYAVTYVGNPVQDAIRNHVPEPNFLETHGLQGKKIVAILPGSRKAEVEHMLQTMLSVIETLPDYFFVVAGVDNLDSSLYACVSNHDRVKIIYNATYDLLRHAQAAVVTSGTATLETALLRVPQVVCYKTSTLTYYIIRVLIQVPYISLVNLIAGREVVRELIQHAFTSQTLAHELHRLLHEAGYRAAVMQGYEEIASLLGTYDASERAADAIFKTSKYH